MAPDSDGALLALGRAPLLASALALLGIAGLTLALDRRSVPSLRGCLARLADRPSPLPQSHPPPAGEAEKEQHR